MYFVWKTSCLCPLWIRRRPHDGPLFKWLALSCGTKAASAWHAFAFLGCFCSAQLFSALFSSLHCSCALILFVWRCLAATSLKCHFVCFAISFVAAIFRAGFFFFFTTLAFLLAMLYMYVFALRHGVYAFQALQCKRSVQILLITNATHKNLTLNI